MVFLQSSGLVSIVTTACIVHEVRSLGEDLLGAALVAKRFSQRHCGHRKSPVDASSCILSMIGKKIWICALHMCTFVYVSHTYSGEGRRQS